jgi:kynurenine formamidase
VLPAGFHELAARVRNWGRWGDDDELGTLNLIDNAAVRRGLACARDGRRFSLAMPLEADGIQMGFIPGRINPQLTMHQVNEPIGSDPDGVCANDDAVSMGLQAATHWDGLCHVSYGGHLYNGYPASAVTAAGTTRCGIQHVQTLVSRGVLLDVARARGTQRLDGGYPITGDDLDAAVALARVTIEPGDVVLLRTGQMEYLRQDPPDKWAYIISAAGPSMASVTWFRDRDVAAVATDNLAFEVYPWEDPEVVMPVHLLHIVEMGLTQGQNWVLDDLAADCAADGRYAFLLEASPQTFVGAAGSPVNPVAIK